MVVGFAARPRELERPLDAFEKAELDGWIDSDSTIVAGTGCSACDESGYSGRTGIHEMLVVDAALRTVIAERPAESTILEIAREKAFATLWMDGVEKVKAGVTTPRELLRVAPRHERFVD